MRIESIITGAVNRFFLEKGIGGPDSSLVQLQKTRKEFKGDITLVVFPLIRLMKKSPADAGEELGRYLSGLAEIKGYNVINGFLNLTVEPSYWAGFVVGSANDETYGLVKQTGKKETVLVEFSSPNTNKPLHLGHIRNNLLGYSISLILEANGLDVKKVNLVNDRGIHICKTMLAWQKWGENRTPAELGIKGDHFVGDMYVRFETAYRGEVAALVKGGMSEDEAMKEAPLIREAREMLRKWEADDQATKELWKRMNGWVYEGFDVTYRRLGVSFDRIYYESDTYHTGKSIIEEGLKRSVLKTKDDGSVGLISGTAGLMKNCYCVQMVHRSILHRISALL
jgi:arginyl-tRNA synthetase